MKPQEDDEQKSFNPPAARITKNLRYARNHAAQTHIDDSIKLRVKNPAAVVPPFKTIVARKRNNHRNIFSLVSRNPQPTSKLTSNEARAFRNR